MFSKDQYFVFMDYETTGVDTSSGTQVKPIQIGCIWTDRWLNVLYSYQELIKWSELMTWEKWPLKTVGAYNIHRIPLKSVLKKGKYPHEIAMKLIKIDKKIRKNVVDKNFKPVIVSDAPNFEMFWTEMIFGSRGNPEFPFHYNAWCVYPTLKLLDVKMGKKPHDALEDARLMLEGMREVYKKLGIKE